MAQDEDGPYCINCGHHVYPPLPTPEEMVEQWGANHLRGGHLKGKHQPQQGTVHGLRRMV